MFTTVDREIFVVKNFSSITSITKIKQAKYFLQRTIRVRLFTHVFEMALLRYLKRVDGLPDPKGPLTSSISYITSGGSRILKRGGSSAHVTDRKKRAKRARSGGVARGDMSPQEDF